MDKFIQMGGNVTESIKPTLVNASSQDDSLDVQQWQRYIEQEIGFVLPNVQRKWLINAIDNTALSYGLTAKKLWNQLPKNNEMRQQLLDNVLIHESRFFRYMPSIEFVKKCALDNQRLRIASGGNSGVVNTSDELFRIWSVGCASGEEVWSLAMSLAAQQLKNHVILGTDVSQQAIINAELGYYNNRQKLLIPPSYQQFVQPLYENSVIRKPNVCDSATTNEATTSHQAHWQIAPSLQQNVSFALHNIMEKTPPTSHLQQIIICQNMLIYFRKFDQRDILARLSEQCVLGGYIILAPGEALFWRPSNMRRIAHPQVNVW
ncbi:MAG: CheR family methyltransferase, partial [Psychrobacter sp.]